MKEIIRKHNIRYPYSTVQDWFKLIYQSEFGNSHMQTDEQTCLEHIRKELENTVGYEGPLVEDIGNGYVRVHLGALKNVGISTGLFSKIVMQSKELSMRDDSSFDGFWQKISVLEQCITKYDMNIDAEQLRFFEKSYFDEGCPVISHSQIYKQKYNPAYRVVNKTYADKIDLFSDMEKRIERANKTDGCVVVAIDGMATSGKTMLSDILSSLFECGVIHMDDFFLQTHQRTAHRLSEPGGNVDYERFMLEVITNIREQTDFIYHAYDCMTKTMHEKKHIHKTLNVIEGAYSMHPLFGNIYDIRIFMYTDGATQKERVLLRNGSELSERFLNEWIPMENEYLEKFDIKGKSTYIFGT